MKTMQKFILLAIVFATQAYAVVHSHSEMSCFDNKGNVAKNIPQRQQASQLLIV
ncbi:MULTISPECIES: hypothetical protein [Helicobacter]|uniref:Periplasmic protein n=1 Tax=Helicobacter typhlonius TaxID=76936 RepID=A0A0S4PX01_9HELI|nr:MULTISPECIES: hypothetical protein [Helicobacter]CUU39872.1 Hypothetical protein BN2458_PEG0987 [Helicobacter typhlonius]